MAPAEDDISIDEKRVYAGSAGRTDAYVATGTGIVRVSLSADKIGAFDMVARDAARDVAVLARGEGADLVAAATPDGLSVAAVGDDPDFEPVDDEPAVAVGVAGGRDGVIVAREDGAVERVEFEESGTAVASTARLGSVAEPRAVDGALVAGADGVFRVGDGGLTDVGLDDARDVAGSGMPLAATGAGLYWLGNGWMTAREGDGDAVAADGDGHAMAVVDGDLLVHADAGGEWGDEAWETAELPVDEAVIALGYGPGVSVAVTDAGTLCVDAGDGWRHQVVGVRDVEGVALAVVE
ncbi:HVO_0234 family beta-propeller protein [Halorubrum trapanicum]|uniref:HVO_0234 family beta-propeller protein n=1 Tax=Halorubrum trapanicum TaxID=29284 RepID=UPI003C6F2FA3